MTPLIDLYRKVSAAWPEMPSPLDVSSTSTWRLKDQDDGASEWPSISEPTARLICAAVWAEWVLQSTTKQRYEIDPEPVAFADDDGFGFAVCDYGDLNQMGRVLGRGPDLCEAAANALLALAKER